MAHFILAHFLAPFAATCALPGILAAPLLTKREEMGFLAFAVYAAIGGLATQLAVSFVASASAGLPLPPDVRIIAISAGLSAFLGWRLHAKKNTLRIRIGAYETASLIVLVMSLAVLRSHFKEVEPPYFNAASDQYYWLAYAETSLYDPAFVAAKVFTSEIHRPVFFLLLAPYAAFFPKDLDTYQNLMVLWTYGTYALAGIAIAELARAALKRKMLGLMSIPALFSFHWINYYLISGDLAPQGLALFFFITGLLLLEEGAESRISWLFLATFYAIHLGTLAVFGLIAGIGILLKEGGRLSAARFRKRLAKPARWHLFEKMFFLPAATVIVLYGLYASQAISYFKPSLITYYAQYEERLTLFTQPYFGKEQAVILWFGIAGAAIALFRKRIPVIAVGLAVPWVLLVTPLLAYHAFYASWQSFRYYLFLYPSAVVLALFAVESLADGITRITSDRMGKGFVFAITLGLLPVFALAASNQQKMVFFDMIRGRDDGAAKKERYAGLEKLLETAGSIADTTRRPVAIYPQNALTTTVQWAFSPRETLILADTCDELDCPAQKTLRPAATDFFEADPVALLVGHGKDGEAPPEINAKIKGMFLPAGEAGQFSVYLRK